MPRGDRTGPASIGPRSGRALGYCSGYPLPGYANTGGMGFGRGRGWRHRSIATGVPGWQAGFVPPANPGYYPPYYGAYAPSKEEEVDMLRREMDAMESSMKAAKDRLEELEKEE